MPKMCVFLSDRWSDRFGIRKSLKMATRPLKISRVLEHYTLIPEVGFRV